MATYKLRAPLSDKESLPSLIKGVGVVDLTGKGYEKVYPATILGPEKRVKVPGATQEQLKRLFESGSKIIEKVEETKSATKVTVKERMDGE